MSNTFNLKLTEKEIADLYSCLIACNGENFEGPLASAFEKLYQLDTAIKNKREHDTTKHILKEADYPV